MFLIAFLQVLFRRFFVRSVLCAVLSICLLFSVLQAQTPSAEITGTVSDASGGFVAGATVTITNVNTNQQRVSTTNSSGVYDAPALAPGSYSVKVANTGFKTEVRNNIVLQVDQVARLDVRLQVGSITETVEVAAEVSALQTETAS